MDHRLVRVDGASDADSREVCELDHPLVSPGLRTSLGEERPEPGRKAPGILEQETLGGAGIEDEASAVDELCQHTVVGRRVERVFGPVGYERRRSDLSRMAARSVAGEPLLDRRLLLGPYCWRGGVVAVIGGDTGDVASGCAARVGAGTGPATACSSKTPPPASSSAPTGPHPGIFTAK